MVKAFKNAGVDENILKLVDGLLRNRRTTARMAHTEVTKLVNRGTPQGGILSSLLNNILMDDLLKSIPKSLGITVLCDADNLVVLITGKNLEKLKKKMQKGLDVIDRWAINNKMTFSPGKIGGNGFLLESKYKRIIIKYWGTCN